MKPIIGMNDRLVAVVLAGCFAPPAAFGDQFSWQVAGRYEDMNAANAMESSRSSVRAPPSNWASNPNP